MIQRGVILWSGHKTTDHSLSKTGIMCYLCERLAAVTERYGATYWRSWYKNILQNICTCLRQTMIKECWWQCTLQTLLPRVRLFCSTVHGKLNYFPRVVMVDLESISSVELWVVITVWKCGHLIVCEDMHLQSVSESKIIFMRCRQASKW